MLQVKKRKEMPSGAEKEIWEDVKEIYVSIFENNDILNTQSVRYNESTHTGLTFYKDIKEHKNRLVKGDVIYSITSAKTKGRLTTLLLKVVDTDV